MGSCSFLPVDCGNKLVQQIRVQLVLPKVNNVNVDLFFVEGHRLVELIITALLQLLPLVLHGLLIEEVLRGAAPVAGLPRLIASLTAEALLFWGAHVPPLVLMIACGVVSAILGDEEDRVDLGDGHGGAGVDALIGFDGPRTLLLLDGVVGRACRREHGLVMMGDADVIKPL